MEQMVKFIPGENGNPGHFVSPLPIKPYNINSVKGNRTTADEQNRQMVLKLQKDPEALEQVREEMKKLQDLGFIVKLKDFPRKIQEELKKDFKHFIPTTIAYKETSASTKTRICWDSSRTSRESASLNSILLKGSAEYSVVKMLVRFREDKHCVSADIMHFCAQSYQCSVTLVPEYTLIHTDRVSILVLADTLSSPNTPHLNFIL